MKKSERIVRVIGDIDNRYITEAGEKIKQKKRRKAKAYAIVAAVACLFIMMTSAGAWLFAPFSTQPGSVAQYSESEYYPIIEKLNVYNYKAPKYKNNFEVILGRIGSFFTSLKDASGGNLMGGAGSGDAEMDGAAGSDGGSGSSYEEITDNQVAGVIEADLIKRTDTHIFYLYYNELSVYSIAGADSSLVSTYTMTPTLKVPSDGDSNGSSGGSTGGTAQQGAPEIGSDIWADFDYYYNRNCEFYITPDCSTAIIIAPASNSNYSNNCVSIISLDISNPENITKKNETVIDGSYVTSRYVDGSLILVTSYSFGYHNYSRAETYVPSYYTDEGRSCLPMENIILPEKITSQRYLVVSVYGGDSTRLVDAGAFLSYSDDVYVSRNAVYALRKYSDSTQLGNVMHTVAKTEIARVDYSGEGLELRDSITVDGTVKDRFSLDEKDGQLRVVTTISETTYQVYTSGSGNDGSIGVGGFGNNVTASLYVYDLEKGELLASVDRFAPKGESVQSARFEGDNAYVCTSIVFTDPVFFFDLSDLGNITYKDTGTITGFSSSLIKFGDYLIGIGREDWSTLKIEVYEETEAGVRSVDKFTMPMVDYSMDYKSYYIDRENMLIGLGVDRYDYTNYAEHARYILIGFDGEGLVQLVDVPVSCFLEYRRSVYIDGYLYVMSRDQIKVIELNWNR